MNMGNLEEDNVYLYVSFAFVCLFYKVLSPWEPQSVLSYQRCLES